jgi:Fe-S cluster assembly protein SufD
MVKNNNAKNLIYIDDLPTSVSLEIKEGETLHLELASFKSFSKCNIEVNVQKNGHFDGAFADFSVGNCQFNLVVNLLGEGSTCLWKLASLANQKSNKIFEPSAYHFAPHTEAKMLNYGIARDEANLIFAGVSEIKKGAIKANTRQEAKIIVFDHLSRGRASPILKIGDNDVNASHSASIGRLNEDHLFYLESRGISLEEAKRLITLGYLKPIEDSFEDETIKKRIDEAIEGGL